MRSKSDSNLPTKVASGIALHALHAAMGAGMAPLSLRKSLLTISVPRRAALVADLPAGVLQWSGPSLGHELCEFLKRGTDRDVWLAVVELMSRSGSTAWTDSLGMPLSTPKPAGTGWTTLLGVYDPDRSSNGSGQSGSF